MLASETHLLGFLRICLNVHTLPTHKTGGPLMWSGRGELAGATGDISGTGGFRRHMLVPFTSHHLLYSVAPSKPDNFISLSTDPLSQQEEEADRVAQCYSPHPTLHSLCPSSVNSSCPAEPSPLQSSRLHSWTHCTCQSVEERMKYTYQTVMHSALYRTVTDHGLCLVKWTFILAHIWLTFKYTCQCALY